MKGSLLGTHEGTCIPKLLVIFVFILLLLLPEKHPGLNIGRLMFWILSH